MKCIKTKAPGKLMIAGEYAVTEPGEWALVMAVDRYIEVTLSEYRPGQAKNENLKEYMETGPYIEALGLKISWKCDKDKITSQKAPSVLDHLLKAMETAMKYVRKRGKEVDLFNLRVESQLHDPKTGKKLGFGSSAALIVAVIKGILAWTELDISQDELFVLALRCHSDLQASGSGGDVAGAVYGGFFAYRNVSREILLENQILKKESYIQPMVMPEEMEMVVGWTGYSASTKDFLSKYREFTNNCSKSYGLWLKKNRENISGLIRAFKDQNADGILEGIYRNHLLLLELDTKADLGILSQELVMLVDAANGIPYEGRLSIKGQNIGDIPRISSGKLSGAGGGDCGICFIKRRVFKSDQDLKTALDWLELQWQVNGIVKTETCIDGTRGLEKSS